MRQGDLWQKHQSLGITSHGGDPNNTAAQCRSLSHMDHYINLSALSSVALGVFLCLSILRPAMSCTAFHQFPNFQRF